VSITKTLSQQESNNSGGSSDCGYTICGPRGVIYSGGSCRTATTPENHELVVGPRDATDNASVSVVNETMEFINGNVNVSFIGAAQAAQRQITNWTVFGGHLAVVQGYLVYTFFVSNTANQIRHLTVVETGNSNVLYNSEVQSLGSFSHSMFGHSGGNGYGGWSGPWKGQW
jgi:hypothetical protein